MVQFDRIKWYMVAQCVQSSSFIDLPWIWVHCVSGWVINDRLNIFVQTPLVSNHWDFSCHSIGVRCKTLVIIGDNRTTAQGCSVPHCCDPYHLSTTSCPGWFQTVHVSTSADDRLLLSVQMQETDCIVGLLQLWLLDITKYYLNHA